MDVRNELPRPGLGKILAKLPIDEVRDTRARQSIFDRQRIEEEQAGLQSDGDLCRFPTVYLYAGLEGLLKLLSCTGFRFGREITNGVGMEGRIVKRELVLPFVDGMQY